jgi:Flp pilus assembly protein TadG
VKRRRDAGQSLVEMALVLPILLLILLAIFDFGRAIYAYNIVSNSAREGARVAIVNQSETAIVDEARNASIGLDPTTVDVTFSTCPPPVMIGCQATVDVAHEWSPITPIIGSILGPITVSSTTEMPIERVFVSP